MPLTNQLFASVEDYLNDMGSATSPPTSPSKTPSGNKKNGNKSQIPNSGSNDRQGSSRSFHEPRRLSSSSITTMHVKTLNELCQTCPPQSPLPPDSRLASALAGTNASVAGGRLGALQTYFDVVPVSEGAQTFKVELKLWRPITLPLELSEQDKDSDTEAEGFVEKVFNDDGPYPSKKHAREAIAKVAIEWLEKELESRWGKAGKTKGFKRSNGIPILKVGCGNAADGWGMVISEGDGKNWIGMLNEYVLKKRIDLPEYIEYGTYGNTFSCEVRIKPFYLLKPTGMKLLSELEQRVFGDKTIRYTNKKLAKTFAAKALVEYLKEQDPSLASGNDSLSPTTPELPRKKRGLEAMSSSKLISVPKEMGYREKLSYITLRLGIKSPEYRIEGSDGLYDASVFIARPYAESDMLIGPVKNVYGKDKAKLEIAKEACRLLYKEAVRLGFQLVGLEEFEDDFNRPVPGTGRTGSQDAKMPRVTRDNVDAETVENLGSSQRPESEEYEDAPEYMYD